MKAKVSEAEPVSAVHVDDGAPEKFSVWECVRGYLYIPFAILIICVVFTKVVLLAFVPSSSMLPTLQKGDFMFCNRLVDPASMERGDIIVFSSMELNMDVTKRIIGLPGETVTISNNTVYINGEPLDESEYLSDDVITSGDGQWEVPANSFFMMGDNREYSHDSRFWGAPFVSFSSVLGKQVFMLRIPFISPLLGENPF